VEARAKETATRRILGAARLLVARGGAAQVSMGEVAAAAGVSKALVLYHFHDKDSLLRALVEDVGRATLDRARGAIAAAGREHALDEYWTWLSSELERGDIRILVSLAEYDSESVREAARVVSAGRRELAGEQVALIFSRLGLTPRVPPTLVADTVTAFVDGLAVATSLEPDRNSRLAFDVLWLALLTLVE
jgi:AcrR family transcriptional regulator